jgi:hypothetical protein
MIAWFSPSAFGPGVFLPDPMPREKRAAQVKAHIPQSLREQLELFVQEEGNVVSMSDYLHRVIEEHVAMRIVKQKIGRRVGNQ